MLARPLTRLVVDEEERHLAAEVTSLEANRSALAGLWLPVATYLEHARPPFACSGIIILTRRYIAERYLPVKTLLLYVSTCGIGIRGKGNDGQN
jgi:hypothetical protein